MVLYEIEIWKDVIGFEGIYQISCLGYLRSVKKVLMPTIANNKYVRYTLCNNCFQRQVGAHILVAEHFIDNPENKPQVNHKDGDKSNPFYKNLEWATPSEDRKHCYQIGLQIPYQSRLVLDLNSGIFFQSIKQAAKSKNVVRQTLDSMLRGKNSNPTSLILI